MAINPDPSSPSKVRGISLTEVVSDMLDELAEYYSINASTVVRELIKAEYADVVQVCQENEATQH